MLWGNRLSRLMKVSRLAQGNCEAMTFINSDSDRSFENFKHWHRYRCFTLLEGSMEHGMERDQAEKSELSPSTRFKGDKAGRDIGPHFRGQRN